MENIEIKEGVLSQGAIDREITKLEDAYLQIIKNIMWRPTYLANLADDIIKQKELIESEQDEEKKSQLLMGLENIEKTRANLEYQAANDEKQKNYFEDTILFLKEIAKGL